MVGGTAKVQFLAGVLLSKSICICSYPPSMYPVGTGSCLLKRLVVGVSPSLFHMVLSPSPLVAIMTWFADGKIKSDSHCGYVHGQGKFLCLYLHACCVLSIIASVDSPYTNTVNIWLPLDWNTTVPLAWNWPKPVLLLHKLVSTVSKLAGHRFHSCHTAEAQSQC